MGGGHLSVAFFIYQPLALPRKIAGRRNILRGIYNIDD
jgi:hypothetical protein